MNTKIVAALAAIDAAGLDAVRRVRQALGAPGARLLKPQSAVESCMPLAAVVGEKAPGKCWFGMRALPTRASSGSSIRPKCEAHGQKQKESPVRCGLTYATPQA